MRCPNNNHRCTLLLSPRAPLSGYLSTQEHNNRLGVSFLTCFAKTIYRRYRCPHRRLKSNGSWRSTRPRFTTVSTCSSAPRSSPRYFILSTRQQLPVPLICLVLFVFTASTRKGTIFTVNFTLVWTSTIKQLPLTCYAVRGRGDLSNQRIAVFHRKLRLPAGGFGTTGFSAYTVQAGGLLHLMMIVLVHCNPIISRSRCAHSR